MIEQIVFLKQHRHRALSRRSVGILAIINDDRPAGWLQKTGDQIEQGAFPGTAWAKHCDSLSLTNGEGKTHWQVLIKPGYISQF